MKVEWFVRLQPVGLTHLSAIDSFKVLKQMLFVCCVMKHFIKITVGTMEMVLYMWVYTLHVSLHRMFCIKCAKLQDVIIPVIYSQKCYINISLIINFNFAVNILMFQDNVRYQFVYATFMLTPTPGKHYGFIPCTWFGPYAWSVRSPGLTSLDCVLCDTRRRWSTSQNHRQGKNSCRESWCLQTK